MSANWLDFVFAAVMLLSVALGAWRGLMHSAFGLIALVVAFTLALSQGNILMRPLNAALESPGVSAALSHAVVFVGALVLCGAAGKLVRRAARKLDLGGLDRFGGFVYGVARGGLVSVVLALVFGALPLGGTRAWLESDLTPVAGTLAYLFVGKGGMLETNLWEFDKRGRPSLNMSVILPAAADAVDDGSLDGDVDSDFSALGLNHNERTNARVDELLESEKKPCAESEDESCAE